jgi:hypothetical protein
MNVLKSLTLKDKTYDSFTDKEAVKSINGLKPDENGNLNLVSSWNDLSDKPFYDETKTATLDYTNLPTTNIEFNGIFLYKVTDNILTTDDLISANVRLSCTNGEGAVTDISQELNADLLEIYPFSFGNAYQWRGTSGGIEFMCMVAVATETGEFEYEGMTFNITETGTYVCFVPYSTVTQNSMTLVWGKLKTLDIKFIPNDLYTEIDQRIEDYINEALGGEY